ncbi:MAG: hypothetical protein JRN28_00660 [Nitrososphaerota archaeon]|nr:hypothetical protein [Nitrososphaerota archaeon]
MKHSSREASRTGVLKRLGYLIFLLLGTLLIVFAYVFSGQALLFNVLISLGTVTLAIPMIQILWLIVGGEPAQAIIREMQDTMRLEGLGLQRFYQTRSDVDFQNEWLNYMKNASEVDILAHTGYRFQLQEAKFLEMLEEGVKSRKRRYRIVTYSADPSNIVTQLTGNTEGDLDRLRTLIGLSLSKLDPIIKHDDKKRPHLQVRLLENHFMYFYILRADDKMLVSPYMTHLTGTHAPTFQVTGRRSGLFEIYRKEFERVWELSTEYHPASP